MSVTHSIGISDIRVVKDSEKVRTVLGSCVGVALYDRIAKTGGLAHVMLPSSEAGEGDPGKFADTAVDMLIKDVIKAGGEQTRLKAKITGGACMFGPQADNGIGVRNIQAVKERLRFHAVHVIAEDVGGRKGRRMILDPATGNVEVQVIGSAPNII